jgi:hypothetical protein
MTIVTSTIVRFSFCFRTRSFSNVSLGVISLYNNTKKCDNKKIKCLYNLQSKVHVHNFIQNVSEIMRGNLKL